MTNSPSLTALAATTLVAAALLGGCATRSSVAKLHDDVLAARQEAEQAKQAAAIAQVEAARQATAAAEAKANDARQQSLLANQKADQALASAHDAELRANDSNERLDRMFRKSMNK